MTTNFKFAQLQNFYLAGAGSSVGDTTLLLQSFTDPLGNQLTMTDFGTTGYITIEPGTISQEESIQFTGITANTDGTTTLTGVSNVLYTYPYTVTSGMLIGHASGVIAVVSNTIGFYENFATLNNDETFTGQITFSLPPIGVNPGGVANASTTVAGIVQAATEAQLLAKTATGSTGAILTVTPDIMPSTLLSDYKVDTGSANAYAITPAPAITAYVTGQQFSFKAANANTTTSTLNVNALGTKTIHNSLGGVLVANDILVGQIVQVEYDGTNFQMVSPLGNQTATALKSATTVVSVSAATAPSANQVLTATNSTTATWVTPATTFKGLYGSGSTTFDMSSASGTQNIAHGLGITPTAFNVSMIGSSGNTATSFNGNSISNTGTSNASATNTFQAFFTTGNFQTGTITAGATNISIAWIKTGSPTGTANIIWSALA